ncbi:flavin reductase family protein [Kosakonia sp. BK9b]
MKNKSKLNSFYYGFPVLLVTTQDSNGNNNICAASSSISLGEKLIIGISKGSKTWSNFMAGSNAVINIPDHSLWEKVEQIGRLTGGDTLSEAQTKWGVEICHDKFSKAGLHTEASVDIAVPRIAECPIQAECRLVSTSDKGRFMLAELDIVNLWVDDELLGDKGIVDSRKWKPLIFNFREYNTVGETLGFNVKYGN